MTARQTWTNWAWAKKSIRRGQVSRHHTQEILMLDIATIQNAEVTAFLPEGKDYIDVVPGRVAHIDADFLAYYAAYEREGENKTLQDMVLAVNTMVTDLRKSCGAQTAVLHVTPQMSDKAGRSKVAVQKAYQSARSGEKPRLLEAVRAYMESPELQNVVGKSWMHAEADDGMAEAAWAAWDAGTPGLCVIASKDKDLRIVPGLHFNFDTGEVEGAGDAFGFIDIKTTVKKNEKTGKTTKSHKPRGYGTKFFWRQMLMGDTADTIVGIPKIGIVKAQDMLDGCSTDLECFQVVKAAYKEYAETKGFIHWETKEDVSWADVFWSEAQMLWMQRTAGDIDDVRKWLQEVVNGS